MAWRDDNMIDRPWLSIFNPIGRLLVNIAAANSEPCLLRVYDVAAVQRLLVLAYQLRRNSIAAADVPGFKSTHPEWAAHPINNTPFKWCADSLQISMLTQSRDLINAKRRFVIRMIARD